MPSGTADKAAMPLSSDALIAEAVARAGNDDFGPDGWREGLDRMVASINHLVFKPSAGGVAHDMLLSSLVARLRIEKWIAEHPNVLDERIERPVIITGLPRTASTAIQNNLAADPQWRFLRGWEAKEPVPPPVDDDEAGDPRYLAEKAVMEQDRTFAGKHIQAAGGPVEDTFLHRLNFGGQEQWLPIHDYTEWWRGRSLVGTYTYQARAMKLLQSRQEPRNWMIKSPWYSFHLGNLLTAFGDAALVMTHRHPGRIIPSVASLVRTGFSRYLPEQALDKKALGRWQLEHWSTAIRRAMEYRARYGGERIFDITHQQFNADPLGVLHDLYDWLGVKMSAEGERRMRDWAEQNRRGVHGSHSYTAEEYGLTESMIEEAFGDYIEAFRLRE